MLLAPAQGYIETIDYEQLAVVADKHDVLVRRDARPGQFVCEDGWIGAICPREAASPALIRVIHETLLIGPFRTPNQDIEFSIARAGPRSALPARFRFCWLIHH